MSLKIVKPVTEKEYYTMTREIKFRVWNGIEMVHDITTGKFGTFYVNPDNNGIDRNDSASMTQLNTKYPDTVPVMQWTGLKDKNGRDIYEGDIYEMYGHNYKIVFDNGAFCITGVKRHATTPINWKPETEDDCMIEDFASKMEIIGNIHQNPELL